MIKGKPLRIAVIYEPGKSIKPVWFELNHKKHEVREITYHWRDKVGTTVLLHYAVTDGSNLYELVFNPSDQSWSLYSQQSEY